MKQIEMKDVLSKKLHIYDLKPGFHMLAKEAWHSGRGDISRPTFDICLIYNESENYYIGEWVSGLKYKNVIFPKSSTRYLTDEEVKIYNDDYMLPNSSEKIVIMLRKK